MKKREEKPKSGKVRKAIRATLLVLAIYAVLVCIVMTVADGRHVRFYLVDGPEINVAYGKAFTDPGCYAVSTGRITGEGESELAVETTGEVDTGTLGTYELRYTARYRLRSYSTTRIVHVVDLTPPVITLDHVEGYAPTWFTGYQEEGFSAFDDCDGYLTEKVERTELEDRVEYRVSDAAGNTAEAVRQIGYTITRPEIYLEGGEELEISAGLSFDEPGYHATDSLGNDLTKYVQIEGEVIPYKTGTYELWYFISNDEDEETVSVTRTVTVTPVRNPDTVQPDGYVIYLTFDDGPGPYTGQLLDLLAKYNVRATFFVTCINSDYEDLVGRAWREGHSIGVHSASHNYYSIYSSEEAFLADFNQVENMIYRQTGTYTTLFRFPGGSSNTVSSFNPGIMSRLARIMTDMGYHYFDWNVTSGDAGGTTKTEVVVDNIISGCTEQRTSVVLQHDIKDFSVNAVERVIVWALRNGYTFLPLDETSPTAHHGISN